VEKRVESLAWYILIGLIAGFLAGQIMKGRGFGLLGNIIIGIVGALLGGLLFDAMGVGLGGTLGAILTATVGAIILLLLRGSVRRRRI
jgi:uncharacterized membrane protein YeaQ/YmgE (transglycosylase-associated protein family)